MRLVPFPSRRHHLGLLSTHPRGQHPLLAALDERRGNGGNLLSRLPLAENHLACALAGRSIEIGSGEVEGRAVAFGIHKARLSSRQITSAAPGRLFNVYDKCLS